MKTVVALVLAGLVLVSCNSDGSNSDDATTAPTTEESTTTASTTASTTPQAETATIWELASDTAELTTLRDAFLAFGIADALKLEGEETTFFAPTNEAFEAYFTASGTTREEFLADVAENAEAEQCDTCTVLAYHVVIEPFQIEDPGEKQVLTEIGELLKLVIGGDGSVSFVDQDASIISDQIQGSNGVIYLIDGVLIPPFLQEG